MDITYLGHSSFKIKTKSATVVTDPFDPKMVGFKYSGVESDIVTVSHDHGDHNADSLVKGVKRVVSDPGEYEIMDVSILGYQTFHDSNKGEDRGKNTVYVFEAEGLRLCHLGDLGHMPDEDLIVEIGDIDVLMIPVGGEFTIDSKTASELVSKIEPYYCIPMHFQSPGLNPDGFAKLEPVENFLKATALPVENLDKLSVKSTEIEENQSTKVIVLTAK